MKSYSESIHSNFFWLIMVHFHSSALSLSFLPPILPPFHCVFGCVGTGSAMMATGRIYTFVVYFVCCWGWLFCLVSMLIGRHRHTVLHHSVYMIMSFESQTKRGVCMCVILFLHQVIRRVLCRMQCLQCSYCIMVVLHCYHIEAVKKC